MSRIGARYSLMSFFLYQLKKYEEKQLKRHPGESQGPGGEFTPALDTGFRRYDGSFRPHRAATIPYL